MWQKKNHEAIIDALKELRRICDIYGIRFYLLAGSTLGAVRHGGIIPWDDDIDVGFRYDDYYRIKFLLPKELDNRFEYVDYDIDDRWPRLFGKILYKRRVCIDIFIIVKWTDNPLDGWIHWQIRRLAYLGYQHSIGKMVPPKKRYGKEGLSHLRSFFVHGIIVRPLFILLDVFFTRRDFIRLAKWNEKYYEHKDTVVYVNIYSVYSMKKEMLNCEWIDKPGRVLFEGELYYTVGDTDSYLKKLYGDYMTLPPEEKRRCLHTDSF